MHESEKWKWSRSVVSDPQRPHGLQPTRLLRPWDFPGKSTGVGCQSSMTGVLIRRWPWEDTDLESAGGWWRQRVELPSCKPKDAKGCQHITSSEEESSLRASEGAQLCLHLGLRLLPPELWAGKFLSLWASQLWRFLMAALENHNPMYIPRWWFSASVDTRTFGTPSPDVQATPPSPIALKFLGMRPDIRDFRASQVIAKWSNLSIWEPYGVWEPQPGVLALPGPGARCSGPVVSESRGVRA